MLAAAPGEDDRAGQVGVLTTKLTNAGRGQQLAAEVTRYITEADTGTDALDFLLASLSPVPAD
ncbi:hypothetical protein [Humibacter sp. RRB41]|uniref:hypothetical protein n=1 Tax=Humibacter sp. RRB41 TaxID=2919946 RepID=UPI001FA95B74|nr:hypothetical protein [Humibacter sp. RRB41]